MIEQLAAAHRHDHHGGAPYVGEEDHWVLCEPVVVHLVSCKHLGGDNGRADGKGGSHRSNFFARSQRTATCDYS